jgi:hypothetical protein
VLILLRPKELKSGELKSANAMSALLLQALHILDVAPDHTGSLDSVTVGLPSPRLLDMSAPIIVNAAPAVLSVSSLVDHDASPHVSEAGQRDARERGTFVHVVIAQLLTSPWLPAKHSDAVVQRFIDAHASWRVIPDTAHIEVELVSMLDKTLVVGRPDVVFTDSSGIVHIWDWKVSSPESAEEQLALLGMYRIQLAAYAWLLLKANGSLEEVRGRLLFVPLASPLLDEWSVSTIITRDELHHVEAAMRSRMATPAAYPEDQAH